MPARRTRLGRGDRVVVTSPYGSRLGTYDLQTGEVSDVEPAFRATFVAELDEWLDAHHLDRFPGFADSRAHADGDPGRPGPRRRLTDTLRIPRPAPAGAARRPGRAPGATGGLRRPRSRTPRPPWRPGPRPRRAAGRPTAPTGSGPTRSPTRTAAPATTSPSGSATSGRTSPCTRPTTVSCGPPHRRAPRGRRSSTGRCATGPTGGRRSPRRSAARSAARGGRLGRGSRWRMLHGIDMTVAGETVTLDHLVFGPPGVFVLDVRHEPGGKVHASTDGLEIDGRHVDLARIRTLAEEVQERLAEAIALAAGFEEVLNPPEVTPVIAVVGATIVSHSRPRGGDRRPGR